MTTDTYTPAQVAVLLNVHPNTVRSWTRDYADVLSPSARSRPRLLTPRDVAILQLVAQWRTAGLPPDAVLSRLRTVPDTDVAQPYIDATVTPTMAADASSSTPDVPAVPVTATVDASLLLRELTTVLDARSAQYNDTLRQLDARLRTIESRRTYTLVLVVGVSVGLIVGLLLALLLLSQR